MSHLVELFYSEHCLGTTAARSLVRSFVAERPDIVLIEHNVDDDVQLAKSYHLIATPALVIDRRKVMYGVPRIDTLTARVDTSDPALT